MAEIYDIAVDFMDMTDDRRLWARRADVRDGFDLVVGGWAIVGDDDADPRAARVLEATDDGLVRLEVLPGPLDAHRGVFTRG